MYIYLEYIYILIEEGKLEEQTNELNIYQWSVIGICETEIK